MRLYEIRFSSEGKTEESELYLKSSGPISIVDNRLSLEKGTQISFGTYFNSFSVRKWKKYTSVSDLEIRVEGKGEFSVRIVGAKLAKAGIVYDVLLERECQGNFNEKINLNVIDCDLLYPEIIAKKANCEIYEVGYHSGFGENEARLAVVFCTFKREDFIKENLKNLKSGILEHRNSLLRNRIQTYVIDNGRTLNNENIPDFIRVIPNPNLGGAGGFTRGIIEVLSNSSFSHILLLDDDIKFSITSLEIVYSFISAIKEDYAEHFIGGGLIDLEIPYLQYERNASWNGVSTRINGSNLDLRITENLIRNEIEDETQGLYAGWWFCCLPVKSVKKLGFPLPFFLKGDDVEYSLRNESKILTVNGIAAWHEAFPKKTRKWNYYYQIRNYLFLSVLRFENYDRTDLLKFSLYRLIKNTFTRNHLALEYTRKALYDFQTGELPESSEAQLLQKSVLALKPGTDSLIKLGLECLSLTFRIWKIFPELSTKIRKNADRYYRFPFWSEYLNLDNKKDSATDMGH
ncbi:glycosyltransferase, group 2 family protein [Leptospira fainei serovar Hurstbridge str. BUT 6]|uniref:Glycosyltransferase, group 2 family protein n=1 Tax=Leptospira fainei serovar Hurstbridge str. BUT 6 TaxID=1193011 RepID=S3V3J5_9LEPT|nr:glycosyltransferase [Leptospira fainei]EPG75973.1 glycosyltransferase, group 2 family protein [Leptospira fainei serovar Hurstbridge str. BUT 6]